MLIIMCIGTLVVGFVLGQKYRPRRKNFDSYQMAELLEEAARKFLVHANRAHVGQGNEYDGDLRYARAFMLEAKKIRQEEEQLLLEA